MRTRTLVLKLCKLEGKKKQIDVAQMTETVGHLADIVYATEDLNPLITALHMLGKKRAAKVKK